MLATRLNFHLQHKPPAKQAAQRIAAAHVVERIDEVGVGRRQRLDAIEGLDAQAGKPVDVGLDAGGDQLRTMVRVSAK